MVGFLTNVGQQVGAIRFFVKDVDERVHAPPAVPILLQ
jgi:hypothetical protein